jgi:hypothetical protein
MPILVLRLQYPQLFVPSSALAVWTFFGLFNP